jgi:hypothetical protein
MGREILRVPSGFDWPVDKIWPGRMIGVCNDMEYIVKEESYDGERCDLCKKWARLSGLAKEGDDGCPSLPYRDPPTGPAYQLWTTTTEGSPMTPAFDTPEELAKFCADNGVSTFGRDTADYDTWLKFIKGPGWAPSMVSTPATGLISGVEMAAQEK